MHFKIWQIPFQNKTKVSPPFLPAGQGREEEEEEYRGGSFESSHSLEKEEGERVTGEEGEREKPRTRRRLWTEPAKKV